MTYKVVVKDEDGTFTRRGYESFREACDACDMFSRKAMENMFTAFIYGRVFDESNNVIVYDSMESLYHDQQPFFNSLPARHAA